MIDMTETEIHKLSLLLAEQQEAAVGTDHDAGYAPRAILRMWVICAMNEGFWRVSGNTALLTSTSLDILLSDMDFSGEVAVLARRMSAHLKGLIAEYEAEIRKLNSLSRH